MAKKRKKNRVSAENMGPAIYVASLSDYNAGRLHGRWIDITLGYDHIVDEIEDMLSESDEDIAEEWAIHDYQDFGELRIGEHEDLEQIAELGELYDKRGDLVFGIISHFGGLEHIDEAKEALEDNYAGVYDSLADYAESELEESGQLDRVPDFLRGYIDFESYASDLEMSGDVFTIEIGNELHVFRSR
jgi:antirestriction protein